MSASSHSGQYEQSFYWKLGVLSDHGHLMWCWTGKLHLEMVTNASDESLMHGHNSSDEKPKKTEAVRKSYFEKWCAKKGLSSAKPLHGADRVSGGYITYQKVTAQV